MELWIMAIGYAIALFIGIAKVLRAERDHAEQRMRKRRNRWNRSEFHVPDEEVDEPEHDQDTALWE